MNSEFNLLRFEEAHKKYYQTALAEIENGRKESHWMWFIFPQIKGLGRSYTSQYYAIESLDEAKAFLNHPYLGRNLFEITNVLLLLDSNNATKIFGKPDDMKLKSCMTLFAIVSEEQSVFEKVLSKFFGNKYDNLTIKLLQKK